jgi:hypothetical protein
MAISKISHPRNARSTVWYLLGPTDHVGRVRDRVIVVASTIGRASEVATRFLGQIAKLRPRLRRHLYHVSISVPPNERELTGRDWAGIGRAWCAGMGLENYLIVLHDNHIHIIASRIRLDGTAAPDRCDYRRSEALLRQIEAQFGLVKTPSSHLLDPTRRAVHRRARSLAGYHAIARDGGASQKDYLRAAIDRALADHTSDAEFTTQLAALGIFVTIEATLGSAPYVLFTYRGRSYGRRALGQGYCLEHLMQRGLRTRSFDGGPLPIARPPWATETAPTASPTERRNNQHHLRALEGLRRLGREVEETIERFRSRHGFPTPDRRTARDGQTLDERDGPSDVL